jgi:prefoldin subunit 5
MVQGWNDGSEDYNRIHALKKRVEELESKNKEQEAMIIRLLQEANVLQHKLRNLEQKHGQ